MVATINDIAKKVGVTKQTVSKIFNNRMTGVKISEETKKRVLDAAKELNYQPNYFAKSLKDKKTNCIGLIGSLRMVNFWQIYFTTSIHSIEKEMANNHSPYSLVVFGAHYNETYEKSMDLIRKGMVDGLILLVLSGDLDRFEKEMLPVLKAGNLPFVVIHSLNRNLPFNNVGMDSHNAGQQCGEHFRQLGYKDVGIITPPQLSLMDKELIQGFKTGLTGTDNPEPEIRQIRRTEIVNDQGYKGGYATGKKITNPPRAIFSVQDQTAFGLIDGLGEQGLRVPEDVAVLSFADFIYPNQVKVGLSAAHHPIADKGEKAVQILTGLLEGKRDKDEVHQEILTPKLYVRKTCGAKQKLNADRVKA